MIWRFNGVKALPFDTRKPCSGRDLNPHAFRHTPLKRTCLPFHHPSERLKDRRW